MSRFLPSVVSLFSLSLVIQACVAPSEPITVLSYNIHHGEGTDGVFDLPRIAKIIEASGADLVALQEVDVRTSRASGVDQAAELARLTGMEVVFGEAIPYRGGSYGDAILSRWPVHSEIIWPLPALPEHERRVVVGGIVELPDGNSIRFLGTHLDHTPGDRDRIEQTKALLALAFPLGQEALPTLLLGDLNAGPGSEPLRLLRTQFVSAAPEGLPSFPSDAPQKAIDWVLFSPAQDWEVIEVGVLDEPEASDHAPLRAVVRHRP